MCWKMLLVLIALLSAIILSTLPLSSEPPPGRSVRPGLSTSVDNSTYINANKILMFITNHGNYGRDLAGVFGNDYGTYYPFTTTDAIMSGTNVSSPLYAAGIWLGGIDSASGDTLVTISEFSSEYVPGPMAAGTYQTDRPEFRVYKLYRDSLAANPNQDYLNWPVDQGAPVDEYGDPVMRGDQMLWTVFNDADPNQHYLESAPIGIEVRQTVWASNEPGNIEVPTGGVVQVTAPPDPKIALSVEVIIPDMLTGHEYIVVTDSTATEYVWHFIDLWTGDTLIHGRPVNSCDSEPIHGLSVCARRFPIHGFRSFEVVANAAGPIDPPESAAAPWEGFPVPTGVDPDGYPTDGQQVGAGLWMISTGGDGGTNGDGDDRGPYSVFLDRTFRGDFPGSGRFALLEGHNWEIRFTGSVDNPGVNGGYAWAAFGTKQAYWIPFELWRLSTATPDDPTDDVRCIPYILGDATGPDYTQDNHVFDLSQYGSILTGTCHDGCEHSISGGDDDPYTDWIYFCVPHDDSRGDAGYQAFATAMQTDPLNYGFESNEQRVMDRLVLANWNGGETPPFTQNMPEQGTIFRLLTDDTYPPGQTYWLTTTPVDTTTVGPEQVSVYLKYTLINKGSRSLDDFVVGLWLDPDLGWSGDDLVGCDTLTHTMFCYNATRNDRHYGYFCPAVGIRLLEGPIVPSPGDTAIVDGLPVVDFRNLGMYAFQKYLGGNDPYRVGEYYESMLGLPVYGHLIYNGDTVRYAMSGDPVTGEGWLDASGDDRRMMASYGPFDFAPGDTQQVILKMAVGQGTDRLSSITALRQVLAYDSTLTGVDDDGTTLLPEKFDVAQNYPNPFNPSTTIAYSLPERAEVEIVIFNIPGQKVATLDEGMQSAGNHSVIWNGFDNSGSAVATGVYFYRVRAGDNVSTKKMLLLK